MNECKPVSTARRRIDIYFRRNGKIEITSRVAWALSMNVGDVLNVIQSGTEYYLYVSRRAEDIRCTMARYPHAVKQRHRGCNTFYCNAVDITRFINGITGSIESHLYVGSAKEMIVEGSPRTVLPLIVANNQFKS